MHLTWRHKNFKVFNIIGGSKMKSLLTEQDIKYLLEQQERLDHDIRKKLSINDAEWLEMHIEHDIALRVEVAEFVNACYKSWKYWKSKPMDRSQVLDEAIDIIHFVMLHHNKQYKLNLASTLLMGALGSAHQFEDVSEVKETLHHILQYNSIFHLLKDVLVILDYYDFDRKQIMEAYDKKNKVNFERLAEGY